MLVLFLLLFRVDTVLLELPLILWLEELVFYVNLERLVEAQLCSQLIVQQDSFRPQAQLLAQRLVQPGLHVLVDWLLVALREHTPQHCLLCAFRVLQDQLLLQVLQVAPHVPQEDIVLEELLQLHVL
jgi:hypothetical protein